MKALAVELESLGLSDIKTYIQSGNVVFRAPNTRATILAADIVQTIEAKFGFAPHVVLLSHKDLAASAANNPFLKSMTDANSRTLHLFFLAETPRNIDHERLEAIRRKSERWQVTGRVFYLYTPEGFGDSKLATQVEKILGVAATARNWRTVCAILDLAETSA